MVERNIQIFPLKMQKHCIVLDLSSHDKVQLKCRSSQVSQFYKLLASINKNKHIQIEYDAL